MTFAAISFESAVGLDTPVQVPVISYGQARQAEAFAAFEVADAGVRLATSKTMFFGSPTQARREAIQHWSSRLNAARQEKAKWEARASQFPNPED